MPHLDLSGLGSQGCWDGRGHKRAVESPAKEAGEAWRKVKTPHLVLQILLPQAVVLQLAAAAPALR